jgi:hypothetical protein
LLSLTNKLAEIAREAFSTASQAEGTPFTK